MPDRLYHVTLTTGHARWSPRAEVAPAAIAALRSVIQRALRGEHAPIPGQPGYTITGGVAGRCCMVTLWGQDPTQEGPRPEWVPVLSVGIAAHSRCGATLWRRLHDTATGPPLATDRTQVPPEPWCADRLEPGAAMHRSAMSWTGDLARCLAWTWIAMRAPQ